MNESEIFETKIWLYVVLPKLRLSGSKVMPILVKGTKFQKSVSDHGCTELYFCAASKRLKGDMFLEMFWNIWTF